MVSTRGVKLKFFDGERVLCYEPDPTKAKVLYDSKVLQVIVNKDPRGRKSVEYLIHFQGWNSSWDRCVSEDFVLKDTPENRQLQKDLADKAQLQLGAYLYRRERKKRKERKHSERILSSEDGSSGSPAQMDTDDAITGVTTSSDSNSSGEEDAIPLELTPSLKAALEHDCYLINSKKKLLKLPVEPHVVHILEMYWKQYAAKELAKISDKPNTRNRSASNAVGLVKHKPEHIQKNINTCKELVDGLRVYFDYTLTDLLLYERERDQVVLAQATELSIGGFKTECGGTDSFRTDGDDTEYSHLPSFDANRLSVEDKCEAPATTKRRLRSHRSTDSSDYNGAEQPPVVAAFPSCHVTPKTEMSANDVALSIAPWRLLPEHVYNQEPPAPCLVYGAVHLARLLVKLPDLLYATNLPVDKLKTLLHHLDLVVEFLSEHKEWFGDKYYVD